MKLMPSCLDASRLLSRALDEPLGLLENAMLRLHLAMCSRCTEVERQLGQLGDLTRSAFDDDDPGGDESGAARTAPSGGG